MKLDYIDFAFYYWCWYNNNAGLGDTKLVKWMGISHRVGSLMSYWFLTENGTVVSRMTVFWVTNLEAQTDKNNARVAALYKEIREHLNDEARVIVEGGKGEPKDWSEHPFNINPDFQ